MAYFISDGSWENYLFAVLGSIFLISSTKEGINEKGVYYYGPGTSSFFVRLAKWEDIKDITLNLKKNKLEIIKLKIKTLNFAHK